MRQSVEILNVFNILKPDFLENENFFKKMGYYFLVESTKIENALFPYKTAISKANVTTNRMVSAKWTKITKNGVVASNYFNFLKNLFQFKNPLQKELIWCTNDPNADIPIMCNRWSFIWWCFFSMSILKESKDI